MSTGAAATDAAEKRWVNARARLCRRGVTAHRIEADNGQPLFVANLGAWTRALHTLDELERFVERVEGERA